MKRRLALFLPSLSGGGAERVMVALANGFAARRLAVDLVLASAEGPCLDDVSDNVRIIDLGAARVLASVPGLVRHLRQEKPTALLSALSHANVMAVAALRLARVPTRLLISEHAHLSLSLMHAESLRGRLMVHFMRWAYRHADGVVAVSKGVADDLAATIGLPRHHIEVIYNPVVSADLTARAQAQPVHPWFAPEAPPVILGVGRLTVQKDFSTLIRAFGRLRAERQARLIILGEGELRPELEALVHELGLKADVALPGFVDNPFAWAHRAAQFVLSSRFEGFGNVLVEAMACGVPVVATDCPSGPAEILEDGKWGRLVPVGDAKALERAMIATLDDVNRPDVAGRAQDFGVDRAVENYLRALGIAHD